MTRLIIVFIVLPLSCFSQLYTYTSLIEKNNYESGYGSLQLFNNLCVGTPIVGKNLIFGFNTEKCVSDYVKNGENPVQDSLVVSTFQVFLKQYLFNSFVFVNSPPYTNYSKIPFYEKIRIGIGHTIFKGEKYNLEIGYDFLITPNNRGFRKGKISLGFSTNLSKLKSYFF